MSLAEYRRYAEGLETSEPCEGVFIRAGIRAREIENALWQPWAKDEARKLAYRFRAIEERSAVAAGCA